MVAMLSHRLLTLGPDREPLWVRLYVHPYADRWVARLVGDEATPLEPGTVTGFTFFGATPEDTAREAKAYLGMAEPAN